jgi:alpha-ketoglutarate-dependent taurine dioxygenase
MLQSSCTLVPGSRMPLSIEFSPSDPDLIRFAAANRQEISDLLLRHGALLFRGFDVGQDSFASFVDCLSSERLNYVYRSTPRKSVADRVFTATIYPANREIPMHCENAYQRDWPMRLSFFCAQPAPKGGETPLADVARVTKRIGPKLVEEFRVRRVRYIRNYRTGVDLPWTEVFQTKSRADVELYCQQHGIELTWGRKTDELRTMQICQGTAIHPVLDIELWFNQAHLFHVSALGPESEKDLIDIFGPDGLPRNASYGDGEAISRQDLELIREAFDRETIQFRWQKGDVLLVDNMQVAHGRRSYVGERTVLVAMSDPFSLAACRT